ncbi:dienelactone hydrolase family protein [Streptomyces montanisoli]|uniref:Dienelactone hydrolase family protein n=1 Tax=Streptomyces montanisoli TaxID=2798581 RepID=A0A940MBR8_9ACTN|nr:dienelactone hydrolase family protein [Streptomyces montanisoli]MBP0460034.1 dienelactone hydrolase family protein [Streptomyces montanisoli]
MEIVLFHSALGVRQAVHDAADRFRGAGHSVRVPDLFGGQTAGTLDEGLAIKDAIGKDELLRRAVTAVAPHSAEGLLYAGFSLGGSIAQNLALGDENARGLLLLHGTSDIAQGATADDLPVQLHVADPDVFEPHDWLTAWYLGLRRAGADPEVFRYPGVGHLYTDADFEDYDEAAAEQTWRTALAFAADVAGEGGRGPAGA